MYKNWKFMIETSYLYHNIKHQLQFSEDEFFIGVWAHGCCSSQLLEVIKSSSSDLPGSKKPYPLLLLIQLELR